MAAGDPAAKYALGSVLNHVLLHQTVGGRGRVGWRVGGPGPSCAPPAVCLARARLHAAASALHPFSFALLDSHAPPTPHHAPPWHQVIGEEAIQQLAQVGETPDLVVGCTGGGSNFAGLCFPFLR